MKFEFDGLQYVLEFERSSKQVTVGSQKDEKGNRRAVKATSRYPYTTVRIIQLPKNVKDVTRGSRVVYRTATVGAYHKDNFTLERGRILALRAVSQTLTKEFKRVMWDAYMHRTVIKSAPLPVETPDIGVDVPGGGAS